MCVSCVQSSCLSLIPRERVDSFPLFSRAGLVLSEEVSQTWGSNKRVARFIWRKRFTKEPKMSMRATWL